MIFPFRPQKGMTEVSGYKNTVLTAYDSQEQRINEEDIPNSAFTLEVKKTQALSSFLNAMVLSQRDNEFTLPIWTDLSTYESSITAGVSSLVFDTTMKRYAVGDHLFIWENDLKYESLEISIITDTEITFATTIQNSYTSGITYLMPAYTAYMVDNPNISYNQSSFNTAQFTFICEMNYEIEDWAPLDSLINIPILFDCEIFADNVGQSEFMGSSEIINLSGGVLDLHKQWTYSKQSRTFGFKKFTQSDIWEFRKFLNYLKGTWKPVYIPTYKNDLVGTENISSSDSFINIVNYRYSELLNNVDTRKYIIIFHDSGYIVKEILNFSPSTDSIEICNLSRSIGSDLNYKNIKISFLVPYRSASDQFEITWNRLDFVECFNNFIEEYVEIAPFDGGFMIGSLVNDTDTTRFNGGFLIGAE